MTNIKILILKIYFTRGMTEGFELVEIFLLVLKQKCELFRKSIEDSIIYTFH